MTSMLHLLHDKHRKYEPLVLLHLPRFVETH